jgi:hypothetical protein
VRIGATGADDDGLDGGVGIAVLGEGVAHAGGDADEVEVVARGGALDELLDLGEGRRAPNVDGLERSRRGQRRGVAVVDGGGEEVEEDGTCLLAIRKRLWTSFEQGRRTILAAVEA